MIIEMAKTDKIDKQSLNECSVPYKLSADMENKVKMAMHEDVDSISTLLKVLADPIRIRILKALEMCDLCVCVLVEITDYKYPALSYHLKLLKDAELIDSHRNGSFQIYHLTELGCNTVISIGKLVKLMH
jgi:DNA-binding transcriptional ArsR family regulator